MDAHEKTIKCYDSMLGNDESCLKNIVMICLAIQIVYILNW